MATPERRARAEDEVELVGVLDEFRTALREELDAARRVAAGAGIQLLNGQLIAHAAESYQYAFTLESVLNLPDDLPGELRIPGRAPVEATIVSLEGVRHAANLRLTREQLRLSQQELAERSGLADSWGAPRIGRPDPLGWSQR